MPLRELVMLNDLVILEGRGARGMQKLGRDLCM